MTARIIFAGDRALAVQVLKYLKGEGIEPVALMLPEIGEGSHGEEIESMCPSLPPSLISRDKRPSKHFIDSVQEQHPHLLLSIHYPYILKSDLLQLPSHAALNLHPSYLPYNRGWHTATWAILEDTPAGATLHHIDSGIDTGAIVHQRFLDVSPGETANSLYHRLLRLELEVFKEAWPTVARLNFMATPQVGAGTSHQRASLFTKNVQELDLDAPTTGGEILRRIRALTTNRLDEAAYFVVDGRRYRIQAHITPDCLDHAPQDN